MNQDDDASSFPPHFFEPLSVNDTKIQWGSNKCFTNFPKKQRIFKEMLMQKLRNPPLRWERKTHSNSLAKLQKPSAERRTLYIIAILQN